MPKPMPRPILKQLTEEAALAWMVNQTILGIERDDDTITLVFATGYMEIGGEPDIYIETAGRQYDD